MRRRLRWDWLSLICGVLAASIVWIVALLVADALGYIDIASTFRRLLCLVAFCGPSA